MRVQRKKTQHTGKTTNRQSLSLPSVRHKGPLDGILFIRQTSERERARNKSTSSQAHADSGAAYIKIRGKSGIIRCAAENVEGIQIPHARTHTHAQSSFFAHAAFRRKPVSLSAVGSAQNAFLFRNRLWAISCTD